MPHIDLGITGVLKRERAGRRTAISQRRSIRANRVADHAMVRLIGIRRRGPRRRRCRAADNDDAQLVVARCVRHSERGKPAAKQERCQPLRELAASAEERGHYRLRLLGSSSGVKTGIGDQGSGIRDRGSGIGDRGLGIGIVVLAACLPTRGETAVNGAWWPAMCRFLVRALGAMRQFLKGQDSVGCK
jgi:hypothetical protein